MRFKSLLVSFPWPFRAAEGLATGGLRFGLGERVLKTSPCCGLVIYSPGVAEGD